MHKRYTRQGLGLLAALAALALLVSACRPADPSPAPEPTDTPAPAAPTPEPPAPTPVPATPTPMPATPTPTPLPEMPGAGAAPPAPSDPEDEADACALIPDGPCYYRYFPVIEGYTQTYQVTSDGRTSRQTREIGEVWADGFNYILVDGQFSMVIESECLPEGLRVYDTRRMVDIFMEGMEAEGESFETLYIEFDGVTHPESFAPGDSWSSTMRWAIRPGDEPDATILFVVAGEFTAGDVERVDTPAGSFEARRIDSIITVSFGPLMDDGTHLEIMSLETVSSTWNAECVGLVKSIGQAMGMETVVELIEYSLP